MALNILAFFKQQLTTYATWHIIIGTTIFKIKMPMNYDIYTF